MEGIQLLIIQNAEKLRQDGVAESGGVEIVVLIVTGYSLLRRGQYLLQHLSPWVFASASGNSPLRGDLQGKLVRPRTVEIIVCNRWGIHWSRVVKEYRVVESAREVQKGFNLRPLCGNAKSSGLSHPYREQEPFRSSTRSL